LALPCAHRASASELVERLRSPYVRARASCATPFTARMGAPGRRVRRDGPAASSGRAGAREGGRRPGAAPTSAADFDPRSPATFVAPPRATRPDAPPSRARRRALAFPCAHRASASELVGRLRSPRVRASAWCAAPFTVRPRRSVVRGSVHRASASELGMRLRSPRVRVGDRERRPNRSIPSRSAITSAATLPRRRAAPHPHRQVRNAPAPTLAARMGAPGRRVRRDGPAASSGRAGAREGGRRPGAAPTSAADFKGGSGYARGGVGGRDDAARRRSARRAPG
jgi:hypothetical protein